MPDPRIRIARATERVLRLPNHMAATAFFDLQVTGKENLPDGPIVVAANHFSHLDPPLIGTNLDRYIRFLAVDELYDKSRVLALTLDYFAAIPLDRDGYPVRAMRTAIDFVTEGNAVGLFPEGRRVEAWGVDAPKRGAGWLAWMTGAPLVPVTIHGTQDSLSPERRRFARTAVRVWIDQPLQWYDYADRVDPIASMMDDWYEVVNGHLEPWSSHVS